MGDRVTVPWVVLIDRSYINQEPNAGTLLRYDHNLSQIQNLQGVPENCQRSNVRAITFKPNIAGKSFTPLFFRHVNTVKMNGEPTF